MPLPDPTSLGLPAKPSSVPAQAGPSRTTSSTTAPATTPASSSTTLTPSPLSTSTTPTSTTTCALCPTPAKYTCPRCSMRTCSLPCSRTHKTLGAGCSGERDPAAFVPLNRITQGTWDGDYAWLEATRRQVGVWGEGVSAEEAAGQGLVVGGGDSRGGGRGGRGGATRGGRGGGRGGAAQSSNNNRKSKLDGLRWAIGEVGAEVDLLPEGMQRRRTNQSSWNPKSRTLFLTVQLCLPPTLSDTPLLSHLRCAVLPAPGATLASLLPGGPLSDRCAAGDLVLVLPHHIPRRRAAYQPPATSAAKRFFPPLDPAGTLDVVFKGTAFVEFPTVQVWEKAEWERALAEGSVVVAPLGEGRKRKAEEEEEQEESEGEDGEGEGEGGEGEAKKDGETSVAACKKARTDTPAAAPVATGGLGLGDYGDSDDDEGNDAASDTTGADAEGGRDITLAPEMAAALGAALVADFGVEEVRE